MGPTAPAAEATAGGSRLAQCDAAASGAESGQVRLAREPGEVLDFCAHHFREFEWRLAVAGWRVTLDNREVLARLER